MNRSLLVLFSIVLFASCKTDKEEKLFTIRHGHELGIDFQNTITTSDTLNALSFEYIYNGSGVGVGDFNNDGLEDLFFGGNQVSSKLYLNKGDLKFTDITTAAGVATDRWVTGVAVVDINRDGLLDIHLAVAGKTTPDKMRDLLFVNQGLKDGIPHFKEMAHEYGIDDEGYGTMGAFFDFDKDGDLDLYLLTNAMEKHNRNNLRPKRIKGEASSTDRLYRNNGDHTFTNISSVTGITIEGYGLGINVSDINLDGWPDVYVANDFMSNDLVWINQQDGTFKNMAGLYLKHQTHNGMGVDIADFNNDALADIVVVDMLPPGHERQKMMTASQNYDHFHMSLKLGYEPQYMRNTLQLNRGKFEDGSMRFSEIAFLSGIAKTDWSWAPLFIDADADGLKDLFVANGYRKDVTDLDFIFFGAENGSPFGTPEARKKIINKEFDKINDVKISNYIYRNSGGLGFDDMSEAWGIDLPSFTNGAAYADLDNDGDVDLVTNNIDQEVIVFENRLRQKPAHHHYLKIVFSDTAEFNQKIWLYKNNEAQFQERTPYRGFQSTVTSVLYFGVGQTNVIDSLKVEWLDGRTLMMRNIKTDITLLLSKHQAGESVGRPSTEPQPYFENADGFAYSHVETSPADIKITRTILHELSHFGPCVEVADVNGDRLDDVFIGGESGSASRLFVQQHDGSFHGSVFESDSSYENGSAHFFDADLDGDKDLYLARCSASGPDDAGPHQLFMNNGRGKFTRTEDRLPAITTSASCVVSADYDNDGDLDLFVGGRLLPKKYPMSPRSYLLRNDNGKFTDVTLSMNPDLVSPGMVSTAVWTDVDNDQKPDLVVAGEWMPLRIFRNTGDGFSELKDIPGLEHSFGWWNCIRAADLNNDGYPEIIAGNAGQNSFFQPTAEHPVMIYAKDFDDNGSVDPVITYYNEVEKDRFPIHNRLVLIDQLPFVKKKFETFRQYSAASMTDIFSPAQLEDSYVGYAHTLASVVLVNSQGKNFTLQELPEIAQTSMINDLIVEDVNDDGHMDILAVGNYYAQETLFGRYDASFGTILLGDSKLNWRVPEPSQSRLVADGDARSVKVIRTHSGNLYLVANNNDRVQFFRKTKADKALLP